MTRNDIKKIVGEDADPEIVDALLDAFHAEMTESKNETEAARKENEEVARDLEEARRTIAKLEKEAPDVDAVKQEISDYKTRIADLEKERADDQVRFAAVNAFREASAHNPEKAVAKFFDISRVKVGKDGSMDGIEEQIKELRKSDAYLFKAPPSPPETPAYTPRKGDPARASGDLGKQMAARLMGNAPQVGILEG